ncbi:MAG: lysophospholipid acyltransferase family protein [Gemmatimonadaceae bacterium]|nr:lysophospholipid acyltransferase family protein [Gemmatimonadaceae bacterium]
MDSLIVAAAGMIIRALAMTWRIEVRHEEHIHSLRAAGKPFIFALWHGQLLPLLWHHRNQRIALVISEHRDGERIARVASGLGYELVRGSSTRGGGRALIQLSRVLMAGNEAAITPDGPKGPARTVAQGVLVAAQRSGAVILPIAATATRAWRAKSWDSFLIPKPFSKVIVSYSEPISVPDETSGGALMRADQVRDGINGAEKSAAEPA